MLLTPQCERKALVLWCARMSFWGSHLTTCRVQPRTLLSVPLTVFSIAGNSTVLLMRSIAYCSIQDPPGFTYVGWSSVLLPAHICSNGMVAAMVWLAGLKGIQVPSVPLCC